MAVITTLCLVILGRLVLLGSPENEISLKTLESLTKVLIYKKMENEPSYCPDRHQLLQTSRPCKISHCFQKVAQLFNLVRDYFPIKDSKRLECVKKCF